MLTEKTRQPTTLYFSALKHFTKCSNNNIKKDARRLLKKLRKHHRLQLFQKTSCNSFQNPESSHFIHREVTAKAMIHMIQTCCSACEKHNALHLAIVKEIVKRPQAAIFSKWI